MKRLFALTFSSLLIFGLLAACGGNETPADQSPEPLPEQSGGGFTVTFLDGDAEIKTETVGNGDTATEYTPEKAGSTFVGWFSTPSKNHYFDFSRPITADTSVFAGFSVYQEDTRDFYIVGSGKSALLVKSNWGNTITDDMKMTKADGKNEYTLTTDLFAGDQLQFAINTEWQNQRGFGYLAEQTLPDGTPVFAGDGGFGDASSKNKNITCVLDGNYTFTLTTFPADDVYDEQREGFSEETKENYNHGTYDAITWVRNGGAQIVVEIETTYYIKGETVTGWDDIYDDSTRMVNDGSGKHTLTVELLENEPFLFTSIVKSGDSEAVGSEYLKYGLLDEAGQALFSPQNAANPADSNLAANAAGTYTFTYDAEAKILTAAPE